MSEFYLDCVSSGTFSPLLPGCTRLWLSHLISLDLCTVKKWGKLKVGEVSLYVTLEAFSYWSVKCSLSLPSLWSEVFYNVLLSCFESIMWHTELIFHGRRDPERRKQWGDAGLGWELWCVKGPESWISSEMLALLWLAVIHAIILICDAAYVCWFHSKSLRPLSQKLRSAEIKGFTQQRPGLNQKQGINAGRPSLLSSTLETPGNWLGSAPFCAVLSTRELGFVFSAVLCRANPK